MREDPTIGIDDRELDDTTLEALAEAYATPPPRDLRTRVFAAARRDDLERRALGAVRRARLVGAIAAGAVLVLGAVALREGRRASRGAGEIAALARTNAELLARLDDQGRALAGLRASVAAQAEILRVLGAPRTVSAALAATKGVGAGGGRVLVDPAAGEAAVVFSGLAAPGAGKVYQLWAIRGKRAPEPAGLFPVGPEAPVGARVVQLERAREITAFAISIEPAGGSTAPTGPIVLSGPVSS
jgi:hypothetical protein